MANLQYTKINTDNALGIPDLSVLNRTRHAPPTFPAEIFRSGMGTWLEDAAHCAGAPLDYVAGSFLAATSALIGNARWVMPWEGWQEPPALWIGLVGDPSSGKSPGSDPVLSMIRAIESDMALEFEPKYRDWESTKIIAKYARDKWEREVKEAVNAEQSAPSIPDEAIEPEEIVCDRVILNDTSMEKAALLLAVHHKGMLKYHDELSNWMGNFDRYGGKGGERSFWLEGYGGRPNKVDRVKHPKPIYIPAFLISVLGGIQPDKLKELLWDGDDGFIARFLWLWPDPIPPYRPKHRADNTLIMKAMQRLTALQMDTDKQGASIRRTVPLTEEAAHAFQEWRVKHFTAEKNVTGMLKSVYGKAPGQLLRLALVIEYLWWAAYSESDTKEPETISLAAIAAAAHLIEAYFKPMAERVFLEAVIPEEERLATALANHIIKTKAKIINVRDITRNARISELRKSAKVEIAVAALVEADWLLKIEPTGLPHRQKKDYPVNPRIWEVLQNHE